MKKLRYIQPNIKIVEVQEETALLTTSDIVTPIPDYDDYEGIDNGDDDWDY